jgi:ribosomal protein S18 acetylase RimI-like enzyme
MLLVINPRLMEPEIASLLAYCVYQPDESKLDKIADMYLHNSNLMMFGYCLGKKVVGCTGVDFSNPEKAVLMHIAVDPAYRRRGIGRVMIADMITQYSIRCLEAETDGEAVDFYRNCGFEVESLGEKYPGVNRYRCSQLSNL